MNKIVSTERPWQFHNKEELYIPNVLIHYYLLTYALTHLFIQVLSKSYEKSAGNKSLLKALTDDLRASFPSASTTTSFADHEIYDGISSVGAGFNVDTASGTHSYSLLLTLTLTHSYSYSLTLTHSLTYSDSLTYSLTHSFREHDNEYLEQYPRLAVVTGHVYLLTNCSVIRYSYC